MFKKFASLALVVALVCALSAPKISAQTAPSLDIKSNEINDAPVSASTKEKETRASGSLKADLQKLVNEARAGKRLVIVDPQNQPRQSNSLSKGAKIAIIAGVAIVVILIIVVIHERNHFFDDFRLGG
jgi:hypothetical protein